MTVYSPSGDVALPRRRRPRRRTGRALVIAVVVLAALLVAADRIAVAVADRAAAMTLQNAEHLDQRPTVAIGGFPFLTQLAAGNFDSIHVSVHDLTVGAQAVHLKIASLDVTLRHVHVSRNFTRATSEFSTATATVRYADLSAALGATVRYAADGRVTAQVIAGLVPGIAIDASATAAVRISGESLTFVDPVVSVGGQPVPGIVTSYFTTLFGTSIPLSGLPFGVHVRGVSASADGVSFTLDATGLTFQR